MVQDLLALGIRNFVMSTSWFNMPPLITAHMLQQGWSRIFSSTLIAANNAQSSYVSGGGVFSGGSALAYFYDNSPSPPTSALVIANITTSRVDEMVKLSPVPPAVTNRPASHGGGGDDEGEPCHVPGYGPIGPRCRFFNVDVLKRGIEFVFSASHNGFLCSAIFSLWPSGVVTGVASPCAGGTNSATSQTSAGPAAVALERNTRYAVYAYNDTVVFDAYTHPLSLQVCGVMQCPAGGDDGVCTVMAGSSPAALFQSLELRGTVFDEMAEIIPSLSVSDSLRLVNSSELTFGRSSHGDHVLRWTPRASMACDSNSSMADSTECAAALTWDRDHAYNSEPSACNKTPLCCPPPLYSAVMYGNRVPS